MIILSSVVLDTVKKIGKCLKIFIYWTDVLPKIAQSDENDKSIWHPMFVFIQKGLRFSCFPLPVAI